MIFWRVGMRSASGTRGDAPRRRNLVRSDMAGWGKRGLVEKVERCDDGVIEAEALRDLHELESVVSDAERERVRGTLGDPALEGRAHVRSENAVRVDVAGRRNGTAREAARQTGGARAQ